MYNFLEILAAIGIIVLVTLFYVLMEPSTMISFKYKHKNKKGGIQLENKPEKRSNKLNSLVTEFGEEIKSSKANSGKK